MQLRQPKYVVKAAMCFHCVDISSSTQDTKSALSNLTQPNLKEVPTISYKAHPMATVSDTAALATQSWKTNC